MASGTRSEHVPDFSRFSEWLRYSNTAAKYREALELSDKMDSSLRIDIILLLTRKASAEHHEAFSD